MIQNIYGMESIYYKQKDGGFIFDIFYILFGIAIFISGMAYGYQYVKNE